MKICFLGTGASYSGGKRLNTSILIKTDKGNLLIDCSGYPEYALAKHGVAVNEITDLVISHVHVDHTYALPSLLHSKRIQSLPQGGGKLHIHAPAEAIRPIQALVDVWGLREKKNGVALEFHGLGGERGKMVPNGLELDIEYFKVCHGEMPTVGISIMGSNSHLIYTADTEICPKVGDRIQRNTNIIHDCGAGLTPQSMHTSALELAEMLCRRPCRRVYLVHLPPASPKDLFEIQSMVQSAFSGQVHIPRDGDSFII